MSNLTSEDSAAAAFDRIKDNITFNDTSYYGGEYWGTQDAGTSHTCVIAPNGDAVSVTSTINMRFVCLF